MPQAHELITVPIFYYILGQAELAEKLSKASGWERSSSETAEPEAIDAALKLAKVRSERKNFVSFNHDSTDGPLGSLAVTHKPQIREPSSRSASTVISPEYGDLEGLKAVVNKDTAAVVFEPIQGETGIIIPPEDFLPGIRDICDDTGALMICDEIQSGMGRTGNGSHSSTRPFSRISSALQKASLPVSRWVLSSRKKDLSSPRRTRQYLCRRSDRLRRWKRYIRHH